MNFMKNCIKKSLFFSIFIFFCSFFSWSENFLAGDTNSNWKATDFWKIVNDDGTISNTTSYPSTSADNVYISGANPITITLTQHTSIDELIISYEGDNITTGSQDVILNLNGFNFSCNKLQLNNGNTISKFLIVDSSATPGTFSTGEFTSSSNTHHLTLRNNVSMTIESFNSSMGTVQIWGEGSIITNETIDTNKFQIQGTSITTSPTTTTPTKATWKEFPTDNNWYNLDNWTPDTGSWPTGATTAILEEIATLEIPAYATQIESTSPIEAQTVIIGGNIDFNLPDMANESLISTLTLPASATVSFSGDIHLENLTIPDGTTISFNQGDTSSEKTIIDNLTVAGTPSINFGNQESDSFEFNGALNGFSTTGLAGTITATSFNLTNTDPIPLNANTILNSTVSIDSPTTIEGETYDINFKNTITSSANLIINTRSATFNDRVSSSGAITITGDATFESSSSISSSGAISITGNAQLLGNIENAQRLSIGGTALLGANIKTSGAQTYTGPVTLASDIELTIQHTGGLGTIPLLEFNSTINSDDNTTKRNLTITGNPSFNDSITNIETLSITGDATFKSSSSISNSGAISITGDATFESSSSISNSGAISITGNAQLLGNIENAQRLSIGGTALLGANIKTSGAQTYTGPVTLASDIELTIQHTGGLGTIPLLEFNSTINSDDNTTKRNLTITGNPSFNDSITNIETLSITGDATFESSSSISNSGAITIEGDAQLFGNIENAQRLSIGGTSLLKANIKTTDNIELIGDTFFGANSTLETANIETQGNVIINAIEGNSPTEVNITTNSFTIDKNFILLNGNVKLNTNLTVRLDIVLLNGNAQTMFNDGDASDSTKSGIKNLFSYHNSLRTSANKLCPPSFETIPTTMPDGTQIHGISDTGKLPENSTDIQTGTFISSLSNFNGKIIRVGQNFYNNGVNLVPGAEWTLQLNENNSSTNSFAEMYNAAIRNCRITCTIDGGYAWLSASENCSDYGNNKGLDSNGNTVNCTDKDSSIIYNQDGSYSRQLTGVAFLQPKILKNDDSKSASEGRAINPEIPNLSGTYSVRDNVIRIEFVKSNYSLGKEQKISSALIENSNNEIAKAIAHINIKYNSLQGIPIEFEGAYIDAECTTSTDGKGDIASFYLKAKDNSRWNIDATGTTVGTKDSLGNQNNRTIDISIEKALDNFFFTLTDEHKNRISSYSQILSSQPNSEPGFLFTATTSRCIVGAINISLALTDFNSDKIYIYFDTPLSSTIDWNSLKNSFKFYSDLDTEYPGITVRDIDINSLNKNGIILILNEKLSFDYIQYGFKIIYNDSYLFTNKIHCNSPRKVLPSGESHCISDFIVNTLDVQYAYDDKFEDIFENDNFNTSLLTIRDFSENAKNNKVFEEKNITLVTRPLVLDSNQPRFNYRLFADISPTANSNGDNFTKITGNSTRAWIPNNATNPILGFSSVLNNSPNLVDSTDPKISQETTTEGDVKFIFKNNPDESPFLDWKVGSNIQFMFEVLKNDNSPFQINHDFKVGGNTTGLYEFRLKNPNNLSSIDLWSFSVSSATKQRGGVSIFSNVINATNKEFCSIEVNTSKEGSLRVIVMTADGNVVKYLENGRKPQGQYYYFWNGTNNSGKSVARGIYFIRIVGSGIDETRKVMVVK